jgi:oligopeptide transport system substrate-binding protein
MRMLREVPRRHVFYAGLAATLLAGACGTSRRRSGRLTYLLRLEPNTLDPAKAPGGSELWIISALFEPLLQPHPITMAPMAGLATHYNIERDGTRYTFYLRGHPAPKGIRLAGPDSLPAEFSRGCTAASLDFPARWSDGTPITAHDIVYSWRRYIAPETANGNAYFLYCVAGAEAAVAGKIPPEEMGVRALDAFAFQVDLRAPAPDFLMVCYTSMTLPMPRHAIEAARQGGNEASWTEPGRMVTSGPFLLKESRPRERTVLAKNPNYFDAALVGVEEIQFSAADGVTVVNLFQVGLADSMDGRVLPLQFAPRMRDRAEFHVRPACACHHWRISTKRAPLDNLLRRYALNMATDRDATARFLGAGQTPAKWRVPPLDGYRSPQTLPVEINGHSFDILAYDPRAARELWASTVTPEARGPVSIHYPARVDSRLIAEILRDQWRENLGLATRLMPQEPAAYVQTVLNDGDFTGVAEDSWFGNYPDPYDALSIYTATHPNWSDPEFDRRLGAASSTADPALRMEKLAACEAMLLRAMPFVPLYFDTWAYLERPEIRGLGLSPLGMPAFKYVWIDTNGRPS